MDKTTQPAIRKEPTGKISMFTVPMKITPAKPTGKTVPRRILLTPAPSEATAVNATVTGLAKQAASLPVQPVDSTVPTTHKQVTVMPVPGELNAVSNTVSQVIPRRVPLTPAGNGQARTIANEVKSDAGIENAGTGSPAQTMPGNAPRRVAFTTLSSDAGKSCTNSSAEPMMSPGTQSGAKESGIGSTAQTLPSNASRRVPLTTLSSDAGKSCPNSSAEPIKSPETNLQSCTKESSASISKETYKQNIADEKGSSNGKKVEQQSTPMETSDPTVNNSQPRRVALTSVSMENPKTSSKQSPATVDKENNTIQQLPGKAPLQPRRVAFTTLTSSGSAKTKVEGLQNSTRKSPVQGAPKRPIPLEPTIIVLDD